ncbi:MAG: hypothetical protein J0L72_06475 [Armatimonadetes bacterium]|nr:hypothetical protein [Armatimonadota bacterium]
MKDLKLTPWTVLSIALSISAVMLCVGYFQYWAPRTETAANFDRLREELEAEGQKLPREKKKLEEAKTMVQDAAGEWNDIVQRKTPPASLAEGGINLTRNRWQLVVDAPEFRNRIQADLNRQLRYGGVQVMSGVTVPVFPDNPLTIVEEGFGYPRYGFPVRIFDFGTVVVEGTMDQITRNVEGWNQLPKYIAVVDGLRLEGTAPKYRASYSLSIAMYLRAEKVSPPVPEVPSDGNNQGAPGGLGTPGGAGGALNPGGAAGGARQRPGVSSRGV